MRKEKLWVSGLGVVLVTLLFGAPLRARADMYQLVDLGSSWYNDMIGITSSGDVVVKYFYGNNVCTGGMPCWEMFARDGSVSFYDSAPSLMYDTNPTPCNNRPPIPVDDPVIDYCMNGRIVFTYAGLAYLYTAPDPVGGPVPADEVLLLWNGSASPVLLNTEGDIAFTGSNMYGSRNYVAYDLGPTPEPSSLVLLATGVLGVAGGLRRRLA